jgi:hypothetical protein
VLAGHIFVHTTIINSSFDPDSVFFWDTALYTKATSVFMFLQIVSIYLGMLCSMKPFFRSLISLCLLPHHPLLIIYSYIPTNLWMLHILPVCWLTMVQVWGAVHVLSYSMRSPLALLSTSASHRRGTPIARHLQTSICMLPMQTRIGDLGRRRPRPTPPAQPPQRPARWIRLHHTLLRPLCRPPQLSRLLLNSCG